MERIKVNLLSQNCGNKIVIAECILTDNGIRFADCFFAIPEAIILRHLNILPNRESGKNAFVLQRRCANGKADPVFIRGLIFPAFFQIVSFSLMTGKYCKIYTTWTFYFLL